MRMKLIILNIVRIVRIPEKKTLFLKKFKILNRAIFVYIIQVFWVKLSDKYV